MIFYVHHFKILPLTCFYRMFLARHGGRDEAQALEVNLHSSASHSNTRSLYALFYRDLRTVSQPLSKKTVTSRTSRKI